MLEVKAAAGAIPKMQAQRRSRLEEQLEAPQGFSTSGEIVDWLKSEFNLEVK